MSDLSKTMIACLDFARANGGVTERRSTSILIGFLVWVGCFWLATRAKRWDVEIYLAGCGALAIGLLLA